MTTNEAKKLVKGYLDEHNLPYLKLTAKTINFSDLARRNCIFVTVHGWQPGPAWADLKAFAAGHDFCVQAEG